MHLKFSNTLLIAASRMELRHKGALRMRLGIGGGESGRIGWSIGGGQNWL